MYLEWKKEWTVPSVVGAVSFAVGVGVGYGLRQYIVWRSYKDYQTEDESEIEEEQEYNEGNVTIRNGLVVFKDEIVAATTCGIEYTAEELEASVSAHPSNFVEKILSGELELEVEPNMVSIFPEIEEEEDDWDYAEEMKTRTPDAPYIIHREEFEDEDAEDGKHYSKSSLTYYKGDDVLCDEHDTPIYNYHIVASPLTFGKGSQDPSIVYIRNEKLEADYEVIIDHGLYQVEVLGEEIEHSFDKKAPLPKFRQE